MRAVLHLEQVTTRSELHNLLEQELHLPEWYGRNLDALWDCLTDLQQETELEVHGRDTFMQNMGDYALRLLRLLRQAAEENENLRIAFC